MPRVDGVVAAVPSAHRQAFRRQAFRRRAEAAAQAVVGHGALRVVACRGDDVPEGRLTSSPRAVKCERRAMLGRVGLGMVRLGMVTLQGAYRGRP